MTVAVTSDLRVIDAPKRFILIVGDPMQGFNFWGPFDTKHEAYDYGGHFECDWWVAELNYPPSPLEDMVADELEQAK